MHCVDWESNYGDCNDEYYDGGLKSAYVLRAIVTVRTYFQVYKENKGVSLCAMVFATKRALGVGGRVS
jgi:hypothetical protein